MKKILFAFSMIFALVACVSEDLPQTNIPREGDKVTLTFGVQVPEAGSATRSMASPAITSLNLLVFDQNGYLVETAAAYVSGNTSWNDTTTPTNSAERQSFTVTLTRTSEYRVIHFVANVADQVANVSFGHEDAIIPSLVTEGDADAYWQRMEFANGVASETGTNLSASTVVPLVRNFAKVTVTESLANFQLEGFVVMNTRSEGTVAAYNARSAEFAQFVDGITARAYNQIIAAYGGFESGEQNKTATEADFTTAAKYVRETAAGATASKNDDGTTTPGTNPYIIVKGKWVATGTPTDATESKYYRLDFVNVGGATGLGALLRNFSYDFTITGVAKEGMSLDEAIAATEGENNLSFQEATQSLLNISDGTGQLFVSATNVTLVSNEPYVLMYKYVPNIANGTANNGEASYARKGEYEADRSAFVESNYITDSGTVADLIAATTDASLKAYYQEFSDYNYITLQPRTPQSNALNDVIVITGGELAREVRFTLQQKMDMTVKAYDGASTEADKTNDNEVPRTTGSSVWVDVTIPANLSEYIFPLEFEIEAEALSLYPDATPTTTVTTAERNNMPVRTGATIVTNADGTLKSGNTFRFVRTLTLDEYLALKAAAGENAEKVTFTSQFLTNKAASASQVYVANHYFNTANDGFENPKQTLNFSNVSLSTSARYYGVGQTVTLTFTAPESTGPIAVKLESLSGLSATGTANADGTYTTTYSGGTHTLTFTTTDWNNNGSNRSARFSADTSVATYNTATGTGNTVNILYIPAGKIAYTNDPISGIEEFTLYRSGNSTNQSSDISNKSNETAFTVTINNLEQNNKVFYVRTDRTGNNTNSPRWYSPLFSAQEALDGFSGNFTTENPWSNN